MNEGSGRKSCDRYITANKKVVVCKKCQPVETKWTDKLKSIIDKKWTDSKKKLPQRHSYQSVTLR